MIVGIGCDIIRIDRIRKMIERFSDRFLIRIFTSREVANAPDNFDLSISYYAKRFAAKEAFSKALGTGIGNKISFKEIEIYNNDFGKPSIHIINDHITFKSINLSLSDEREFALAFIVIEE
jgi:holo-[acyl-carrier protein] synthase